MIALSEPPKLGKSNGLLYILIVPIPIEICCKQDKTASEP